MGGRGASTFRVGGMSRFVSCPAHVRSADLGTAAVLINLRTGRVDTLLGWAHHTWRELARHADRDVAAAAVGVPVEQADELVDQLIANGVLTDSARPCPWSLPVAPVTAASWGTNEVPAAISPPRSTSVAATVLAGVALAGVLAVRDLGRRDRSFARITRLLTAVVALPHRAADPSMVADALHCVRTFASVLPFRVACLEETAAAMLVLALRGRRAGWCHGVAADPIRLHAWIELDGQPVAEPASTARYTPLLQIPQLTGDLTRGGTGEVSLEHQPIQRQRGVRKGP